MTDQTDAKYIYAYKIGPFTYTFTVLMVGAFVLAGLKVATSAPSSTAENDIFDAALIGSTMLIATAFVFRWLRKENLSSKTIVLCRDKIQLPFTKGDKHGDFFPLKEISSTRIDENFQDHGTALIVETRAKSVVYKSMYFEDAKNFEDFCDRLAGFLEIDESKRLEG